MPWSRPSSVPYPQVWAHYVGKRVMADGHLPRFVIQDATEEMFDEIVEHMTEHFLKGEPLGLHVNLLEDQLSVSEIHKVWRMILKERMSLVALVEETGGGFKLAGVNILGVSLVENRDNWWQFTGTLARRVLGTVQHMNQAVDIFAHYNVPAFLNALGLSVAREYRGQGLGLQLLLARVPLCKATGLKVTCNVFTATVSQELAFRAGYEVIAEMDYKDYEKDGKLVFPGIETKSCKTMGFTIE